MTTAPDYTAAADAARREYLDSGSDTLRSDEMFAHVYAAGVARGIAMALEVTDGAGDWLVDEDGRSISQVIRALVDPRAGQ